VAKNISSQGCNQPKSVASTKNPWTACSAPNNTTNTF